MATRKVGADELADVLAAELKKYAKATTDEVKEATSAAGKRCAKQIADNINAQGIGKPGGKYRKSWKVKVTLDKPTARTVTVYSTQYQLAHLLENGHVIKNQTGQIYGKTRPRPHIAPAEQDAVDYLEKLIKKEVKA